MLADDIIAAAGGAADQVFMGGVSALAADIKRAARFDLSQGVMLSAQTVHRSQQSVRMRALALCRLPFQRTWFEWPGSDPSGAAPITHGPKRWAPVPRRVGALVNVDDSRQRGTMTWAWFTKEFDQGVNLCPLGVTFDWRPEPDPIVDLLEQALTRYGLDKAVLDRQSTLEAQRSLPRLRHLSAAALEEDRARFGFVWSPYADRFARDYERRMGKVDPSHPLWQSAIGDILGEPGMLQCVILLLNSRNMTAAQTVPTPERLNKQRARKGRPPLLDYTTISIKLSRALAQRTGAAGERQPARVHVVSGHFKIRKTGIYWWSDFTRGDPTQGVVRQQTRKVEA